MLQQLSPVELQSVLQSVGQVNLGFKFQDLGDLYDDVGLLPGSGVAGSSKGNSGSKFFLLAAAWVCPGRSALQSAKHWCYGRNGHNQKLMRFIKQNNKNMRHQAGKPSTETFLIAIRKRALVKTRR